MALGQRLKIAMEKRGLTQEQLAARANDLGQRRVSQASISALIKLDSKSSEALFQLARALRVNPEWLQDGDPVESGLDREAWSPGNHSSPESKDIAIAWQKLPAERRQAFRDQIFLEAIIATQYPWLIRGRPAGESYDQFERAMERDIVRITKRLLMQEDAAYKTGDDDGQPKT